MALPEVGTPFTPSSKEEVRDAILADIRLGSIDATGEEAAVQPGTEDFIFAEAHAGVSMIQYAQINAERDSVTPLNSQGERLDQWRESIGLPIVGPSGSSGRVRLKVPTGSVTVPVGTQFTFPNGLRGKTSQPFVGATDGAEIPSESIDKGAATRFPGGTVVRFTSPPSGLASEARVSKQIPFTGGYDEESDARKRTRIQNALANKTGGGNWAQCRDIAFTNLASVQDCFVYPALGGPSSVKVVPVRDFDLEFNEFTRAMSTAQLEIVRNAVYAHMPDEIAITVQAAADENVDAAVQVSIPDSSEQGGDGTGWLDAAPWPTLEAGDSGTVAITSVTSSRVIVVDAVTAVDPLPGQTRIVWWASSDRRFRVFLVTAFAGGTGNWTLTVDQPMVDSDGNQVQPGDYISPAAVNSESYGKTWVNVFRAMGPGENTADANRLPRAKRHPFVSKSAPPDLSFLALKAFTSGHSEIADVSWGYRSLTTPTVPGSVSTAPNILVPRHFGIYPPAAS